VGDENAVLLAMIQECIRTGRYTYTPHALGKHPPAEGFTPDQALASIMSGAIIEHYESESRCLTCGEAPGLKPSKDFISTYIHCVCKYDNIQQVVVITMYRPRSDQWVNHFRRRPAV
jgi:hypothetical protein